VFWEQNVGGSNPLAPTEFNSPRRFSFAIARGRSFSLSFRLREQNAAEIVATGCESLLAACRCRARLGRSGSATRSEAKESHSRLSSTVISGLNSEQRPDERQSLSAEGKPCTFSPSGPTDGHRRVTRAGREYWMATATSPQLGVPAWVTITAFFVGVAAVAAILALVVSIPWPSEVQYDVFRIVIALGGAAFATALTGFLTVQIGSRRSPQIVAGGALGVFVVLFFFNPARRVGPPADEACRVDTTDGLGKRTTRYLAIGSYDAATCEREARQECTQDQPSTAGASTCKFVFKGPPFASGVVKLAPKQAPSVNASQPLNQPTPTRDAGSSSMEVPAPAERAPSSDGRRSNQVADRRRGVSQQAKEEIIPEAGRHQATLPVGQPGRGSAKPEDAITIPVVKEEPSKSSPVKHDGDLPTPVIKEPDSNASSVIPDPESTKGIIPGWGTPGEPTLPANENRKKPDQDWNKRQANYSSLQTLLLAAERDLRAAKGIHVSCGLGYSTAARTTEAPMSWLSLTVDKSRDLAEASECFSNIATLLKRAIEPPWRIAEDKAEATKKSLVLVFGSVNPVTVGLQLQDDRALVDFHSVTLFVRQ
jgi:hypothetical protein